MRCVAALLAFALATQAACGSPPGPVDDPGLPLPAGSYDAQERLDRSIRGLVTQARRAPGLPRNMSVVLAPITPDEHAWAAAAATWSLVRMHGGATPRGGVATWTSVPAVQAWLRAAPARRDWVAWLVQVHPGPLPTFELVVCWRGGAWRSGERALPRDVPTRWPWLQPAAPATSDVVAPGAEALRRVEGEVYLENREGRRRLRFQDEVLRVGELHPWSRWDRTPWQRWSSLPEFPRVGLWDGDLRLELRRERRGSDETWRWWITRAGSGLGLPPVLRPSGLTLSLVPVPRAWSSAPAWLLLREEGARTYVQLVRADLRQWAPPPRPRPAPVPQLRITIPLGTPPAWPIAAEELWVRAHVAVPLELVTDPAQHDGGRRWRLRVPTWSSRPGRPALTAMDWAAALAARLQDRAAPAWYDWLLAPLRSAQIRAAGEAVELRLERPVPDLPARLAHPALTLDEPRVADAYASHRGEGSRLRPRHAGLSELVFAPTEPDVRRVFRPPATDRPDLQMWREDDGVVCLITSAGASAIARRRLAAALLSVPTADLLADEDARWQRRGPAGRQPVPLTAAPTPGTPLHVSVQVDPAVAGEDVERAFARLQLVLPPLGIHLRRGDPGPATAVVARLARLAPRSDDPLLRALELRSWAGDLTLTAELEEAARRSPADPARRAVAAEVERSLVEEGRLVPLWTSPAWSLLPANVQGAGPAPPGLPLLLREARRPARGGEAS